MAGHRPISRGWAQGSLVLILLATLTPQAGSSSLGQGFFVPPPTDGLGVGLDTLQNILLYVPLGLTLGLTATPWIGTLLTAAAISLTTELCQYFVPGRDPVATDVMLNVCGAALARVVVSTPIGAWARASLLTGERWLALAVRPDRHVATTLALVWSVFAALVISLTCWLMSPALPGPFYYLITTPLMDNVPGPLRIGGDGSQQGFFNGLIDEVRIYSRDRTPDEIRTDLSTAVSVSSGDPDLLAAYGFDLNGHEGASDASGQNDAVVRGATWTPAGRFGGALSFDGRASQVIVPHLQGLDLRQAMTVEAWIRPAGTQRSRAVVAATAGDTHFLRASSGNIALAPSGGGSFGEYSREAHVRRRLPVNRWTHLAMTYNGQAIVVYVDGRPSVRLLHWSTHRFLQASLDGVDLPSGAVPWPTQIWSLLSGDFTLKLTLKCGQLMSHAAPVFSVVGVQSQEVLTVDAAGSELRVRSSSQALRLGLAPADYRVPGALSACAPGETRTVVVKGPLQKIRIDGVGGRSMRGWGPGVGSIWTFLFDSRFIPTRLVPLLSAAYLALLALPFGFWARFGPSAIVGGVVFAGALALAPDIWGTPSIDGLEVGGIATGVLLGVGLSRAASRKHGLQRFKDDEHIECH